MRLPFWNIRQEGVPVRATDGRHDSPRRSRGRSRTGQGRVQVGSGSGL